MVECDEFRSILTYVNRRAEDFLPTSHNTIKEWSKRTFEQQREVQKSNMQAARSKIHLWSDAWTSGNHHGILATGGTYWSSDNKLTTILMDMKELHGAHTGLNIGRNWLRIVEEWGIQENLGWFTTDNAYSNDAGCRALSTG